MNRYQQNEIHPNGGHDESQRIYPYANGGYNNPYRPYGNPQSNEHHRGRWPQDPDYDEDDEKEKEDMQRLMINLRKIVLPQLEQVIAYILIPMIGSWIFKALKIPAPSLPSVTNISFCRTCKVPVDLWQNPFVKP